MLLTVKGPDRKTLWKESEYRLEREEGHLRRQKNDEVKVLAAENEQGRGATHAIPEKAKLGTGVPLQSKRAFRVLLPFSS